MLSKLKELLEQGSTPTTVNLRSMIKKGPKRWPETLALAVLIKHELKSKKVSTQKFCQDIGINNQRIRYWETALEWNKIRAATMSRFKSEPKPHGTMKVRNSTLVAAKDLPAFNDVTKNYGVVRPIIERMAADLRGLGERFPDLSPHIAKIRKEMGQLIHVTVDLEFESPGSTKQSLNGHAGVGKSSVATA